MCVSDGEFFSKKQQRDEFEEAKKIELTYIDAVESVHDLYNVNNDENNKKIKEQEAKQIMSVHNDFNLPKFDKTVEEMPPISFSYLNCIAK